MPRLTWTAAASELAERDPVVAGLIERHGLPRLGSRTPAGDRFEVLARSIAYQQLAGAAAATIWRRTREAVGEPFTPAAVLAAGEERLRPAGLSGSKTLALLDLAQHVHDGRVDMSGLARRSDDEVIGVLTQVRGIGPWTAQMYLLFTLRRPDVWPTGDYGVRVGFTRAWGLADLPSEKELAPLGDPYRPFRSLIAWWCWREADTRNDQA